MGCLISIKQASIYYEIRMFQQDICAIIFVMSNRQDLVAFAIQTPYSHLRQLE